MPIQKYEPMVQVTCKDGRILYFPKAKFAAFEVVIKQEQFVNIEGVRVNKFEIKYYEDMPKNLDVLVGQSEDIRNACLTRFKEYENNLGKKPEREARLQILRKILKRYEDGLAI